MYFINTATMVLRGFMSFPPNAFTIPIIKNIAENATIIITFIVSVKSSPTITIAAIDSIIRAIVYGIANAINPRNSATFPLPIIVNGASHRYVRFLVITASIVEIIEFSSAPTPAISFARVPVIISVICIDKFIPPNQFVTRKYMHPYFKNFCMLTITTSLGLLRANPT